MSEQAGEDQVVQLPQGDAAFGALMDALAPEPDGAAAAATQGEAGTGAGAAAPGAAGAAGAADGAGDGAAGRPAAGEPAGQPAAVRGDGADAGAATDGGAARATAGDPVQPAADGGGAGAVPADWTVAAADLVPELGKLSNALEESTSKAYQAQAYEAVRGEHGQYFDALEKHPRLLVGQQVPAIGKEGMETLRDTNDAREWQEAVKHLLVAEIKDRAGRQMEESQDFLQTVHSSIELFQNNLDLVPHTKDFDVELANEFTKLAAPYEVRVDGKLQGYSVPVQPLIDQLRTQVTARRTAAPAAAAPTAATPPGGAAAAGSVQPDPPQAAIQSKAGNSGEKEDFSTLFGTIGLSNLQI